MQRTSLQDLPAELLLNILLRLSPEQAVMAILVNKHFRLLTEDPHYWKIKYSKHFPADYLNLLNEPAKLLKEPSPPWRAKFSTTYTNEFKPLPTYYRRLFSLVKENDVPGLPTLSLAGFLADLDQEDAKSNSLLPRQAQTGIQRLFNYFCGLFSNTSQPSNSTGDSTLADAPGRTALFWTLVCKQGIQQTALLLLQGSSPHETYNTKDYTYSPIHIAAMAGLLDIARYLIGQWPELLNQLDSENQTPLIWAARQGHTEFVDYLLSIQADLTIATRGHANNQGKTAFHWAAEYGHASIVAALLQAGAKADTVAGSQRYQAIHLAARQGHLSVVNMLAQLNPNSVNAEAATGETPFMCAAREKRGSVMDALIRAGADLTGVSTFLLSTAMLVAACDGHFFVAQTLLQHDHSLLETTNLNGNTPFVLAARFNHEDLAVYLITQGADLLCWHGGNDACFLLLTSDHNYSDEKYHNDDFLIWAARRKHTTLVDYLIQKKHSLNKKSYSFDHDNPHHGKTALHWAAEFGHDSIVDSLLKAGARSDTVTRLKRLGAMHSAAKKGHLSVVQMLDQHDPQAKYAKSTTGKTPLLYAASNGYLHLVSYLLEQTQSELNNIHAAEDSCRIDLTGSLAEALTFVNTQIESGVTLAERNSALSAQVLSLVEKVELFTSIYALEKYGHALQSEGHPRKGGAAIQHAKRIRNTINTYLSGEEDSETANQNISAALGQAKNAMGENRNAKDIFLHIVLACFGIGLVIIPIKKLLTPSGFLNSTRRQKLVGEIERALPPEAASFLTRAKM